MVIGVIGTMFMVALEYVFIAYVADAGYWMEYERTDLLTAEYRDILEEAGEEDILLAYMPGERTVQLGEKLEMISNREVYQQVVIKYRDILRCDRHGIGRYSYFSQKTTDANVLPHDLRTGTWEYGGELPKKPMTCKVHSTLVVPNKWGVEHTQTVVSPEITFVEPITNNDN